MYNGNYFWGMDLIWWIVWFCLFVWIFALPYNIPGQRHKKNSALDILKGRFASGQITIEEYEEAKKVIEKK